MEFFKPSNQQYTSCPNLMCLVGQIQVQKVTLVVATNQMPAQTCLQKKVVLKKTKLYGSFLWIGFNCLKATVTSRRQFTFYHSVPRNSWYSFYRPQKDERLSRPWSHPVVLNTGLLDWESSALTTRPLLHR